MILFAALVIASWLLVGALFIASQEVRVYRCERAEYPRSNVRVKR